MTRSALIFFLSAITLAAQITFEPNLGQASKGTEFVARTGNLRLDLASASSSLALRNSRGATHLTLKLAHANSAAKWERLDPLPTRANYFRGRSASTWITDVPTFARVREKAVYPGIDLVYYGGQNSLEYDFVVAPGADPHAIHIRYSGADTARINTNGDLILTTQAGEVVQRKPVLYQTAGASRLPVNGCFVLANNGEISFAIGNYDHRRELIIDPTISFSSFLGGTGTDQGNSIAVDSSGNTYLVGSTTSGSSDSDVLLRKFSPTGAQIYIADLGGSSDDFGNAIQVDGTGSAYVGGRTSSSDFPLQNAFQSKRAGGADAFLLRVSPAGNSLVFSTYAGGSADDFCSALAIDRQGAVYATGTTSADFPPSLGSFQTTNKGGLDAFVIKLDAQGNGVYSTLLGGGADDEGRGIAVDGNGSAYVTGTTLSDSFPQFNTIYQNSRHGGVDAFVTEVNPSGNNLVYSTFLGGILSDSGYAIAVDSSNFVYVAGKTASRDFPTTGTSYQKDYAGGDNDIFVAKFQPGKADVVYVTYIGSRGSDQGFGLAVDSGGNAYITGDTDSDAFPITSDATQIRRNGNKDAIVAKLNTQGTALLFATYLGGTNDDSGSSIAIDSGGNAYITGSTSSNDFPVQQGAFQTQFGGGSTDAFFAKYQFATLTGPPTVSSGGVVNGASFGSGPVAPGSVISIFGTNFIASAVGAPRVPLPTNLGGVSVLLNGVPVPLFYVGPNQINAQVPSGTAPGSATLQVNAPNGTTSQVSFPVALTAPYLVASQGRAVVTDAAGGLITTSNPARVGSTVVVYFTGIGPVNAAVADGAGSPAATSTLSNFATIGGVSAPVAYLGLSPGGVGLGQANLRIPSLATGDSPLILNIGGVASNSALIAVGQ